MGRSLFEKLWDEHVVCQPEGAPALLYIDLHLVHEVTSPQAFDGLRDGGRRVRRTDRTIATADLKRNPRQRLAVTQEMGDLVIQAIQSGRTRPTHA